MLFEKYGKDAKRSIDPDHQMMLFVDMAQKLQQVTIVVDALDECKEIDTLVEGLERLATLESLTARILATGRNNYSSRSSIGVLATYHIALEQNVGLDIHSFVTDEVNSRIQARKLKIRSQDLRDTITHVLSGHANGM